MQKHVISNQNPTSSVDRSLNIAEKVMKMTLKSRDIPIDMADFDKPEGELVARYGMPRDIVYCKRCVIPNQRPQTTQEYSHREGSNHAAIDFDEEGVCDACRVAEIKQTIDWDARSRELMERRQSQWCTQT